MVLARVRAGLVGLVLMLCASAVSAQTTTLTGTVNGSTVSLSWTPVDGATGYDVVVSVNGIALPPLAVGNLLAANVPNVPPGVYQVQVRGTLGPAKGPLSNAVVLTVANVPVTPPAAPTGLTATVNGSSVLLSWGLASTAGLTGLVLQVGSQTGAADLGSFPVRVSTSAFLGTVPNGNYFMRLFAINAGGPSPASNELNLAVPSCVAPTSLPFTVTSNGGTVQGSWPAIPGATGYRLDASSTPGGGPNLASIPIAANQTGFSAFGIAQGTYYLTLHVTLACGATAASAEQTLAVTPPVHLPAKSLSQATAMVLAAVTSTGGVGSSCGNNTWLFASLQKLRVQDDRFGANWKRGVVGDMSQDVIIYNYSDLPNEQAGRQGTIYAWDVIGGHCGPSPAPQASVIPESPVPGGWTIQFYLRAGFTP